MPILAWFLSPIGKYVAIFLLAAGVLGGIYWKIRSSVREGVQTEIMTESLGRITDAIRRGDAVSTDPGELRKPDKSCRDCE